MSSKKEAIPPFNPSEFALAFNESGDYASDGGLIHCWTGTHWEVVEPNDIEREALQWIMNKTPWTGSAKNAKSILDTLTLQLPKLAAPADAAVIPVLNGYLHLDDHTHHTLVKAPDKELGLRYVLRCEYDPAAPRPEAFRAFLDHILPDPEVQARVQEYIGYTLLPDARFQRAQLWIGSGANGKGTLANIVQALHHRTAAVQLDALSGFGLANMVSASLIYCDEAPQRGINEQALKSLIAGELVKIDRKYRDEVSARVMGKWLILANHVPAVTDQSNGFWRRFDIVPFTVEVPASDRDPMLARRIIYEELSGVLNWALEGLERLLARGKFDTELPAAMLAASQAARIETNSVAAWVESCDIALETEVCTPKQEAYEHYASWSKSNGMAPVASPKFWKRLADSLSPIVEGRMTTRTGRLRACNVQLPL